MHTQEYWNALACLPTASGRLTDQVFIMTLPLPIRPVIILHISEILQSDVWTLQTSLTSNSESATASQSMISSVQKPENRLSLSESLKRSVLKTGDVFLRLDYQKLSHFRFIHKDNATWRGGSGGSLILLLFTRFSWDCAGISMYGSSEVYQSRPDALGRSAHGPAPTFSDAAPGKGLNTRPTSCYDRIVCLLAA